MDYLLPGILLITVASGVAYTAFRLFSDVSGGIFERFRAMPISAFGRAVGPRADLGGDDGGLPGPGRARGGGRSGSAPVPGCWPGSAVLGLWLLFTLTLTWLAVVSGLTATSVDGVSSFSYPLILLPFVSSAFVPTAGMPAAVRWFAENQPVTAIVDTVRDLLAERPVGQGGWAAVAWCVGLALLAQAAAVTTYRRKSS